MAYNTKPRMRETDVLTIRCPGRTNLFAGNANLTNALPMTPAEIRKDKQMRTAKQQRKAKVTAAASMLRAFEDTNTRAVPKGRFVPGQGAKQGTMPKGVDGKVRGTRVV